MNRQPSSCLMILFLILISLLEAGAAGRQLQGRQGNGGGGRGGNGKSGKGKSSSGQASPICSCDGVKEYKFLSAETIFRLALARTSGTDYDSVDLSTTELTYTLALALAPPNCYLASAATDFQELRLQAIGGGPGFVGAFKDEEDAYEDRNESFIEDRRSGWSFLDGSSIQDDFWNLNQPLRTTSVNPAETPSVGLYSPPGLDAVPLEFAGAGAYYKCCFSVLPDCYEPSPTNLQNVLLPVVEAMMM